MGINGAARPARFDATEALTGFAKGQVEAKPSRLGMVAFRECFDTMKRQPIDASPNHHVPVKQPEFFRSLGPQRSTPQECSRKAKRDRHDGS